VWAAYQSVIRDRPRTSGQPIKDVIAKSLRKAIMISGPVIELGAFSLEVAKEETTGPEWGKTQRGVFAALEEGYEVKFPWGFVSLEEATHLADQAAEMMPADKRAEFKAHVAKAFTGRHGDGIMVKVTEPLFFEVPEFGTPLEMGFLPHGKWEGWHVLEKISGPNQARKAAADDEPNWLLALLDKAMANTIRRVQTI
jgi:hypothetical protein